MTLWLRCYYHRSIVEETEVQRERLSTEWSRIIQLISREALGLSPTLSYVRELVLLVTMHFFHIVLCILLLRAESQRRKHLPDAIRK